MMNSLSLLRAINDETVFDIGTASAKTYKLNSFKIDIPKSEFESASGTAKFKSDSGLKYVVSLKEVNKFLDVDFKVTNFKKGEFAETNRGEAFKVMATVVGVVKKYLDKRKDSLLGLRYDPQSKGGDESLGSGDKGAGRDRLYRAFISKQIPGVKFVKSGSTVFAMFK